MAVLRWSCCNCSQAVPGVSGICSVCSGGVTWLLLEPQTRRNHCLVFRTKPTLHLPYCHLTGPGRCWEGHVAGGCSAAPCSKPSCCWPLCPAVLCSGAGVHPQGARQLLEEPSLQPAAPADDGCMRAGVRHDVSPTVTPTGACPQLGLSPSVALPGGSSSSST